MKNKDINKTKKDLKDIEKTLENLTKSLEPLFDIGNLEKSISKLSNAMPDVSNMDDINMDDIPSYPDKEGETCIHDRAWHSECDECDAFDMVDMVLDMEETTLNDMELGKKIRQFCSEIKGETTPSDTNQLNLFDDTDD